MKKLVFVTALLLMGLSFVANAQHQRDSKEKMNPEQMSAKYVEKLNQDLKLTDKQQADLKTFFSAAFKKRNENFEKNKDNREAMKETMKKDREATDVEMKKVLTAEQYKTYKANEEKRMQERKAKGSHSGGDRNRTR